MRDLERYLEQCWFPVPDPDDYPLAPGLYSLDFNVRDLVEMPDYDNHQ